jgi:hypothetical protein
MAKRRIVLSNDEAAELLLNTGLLYEINRTILHPLGMALAVSADDAGEITGFAGLTDCCNDPEGMVFTPSAAGPEKYRSFMAKTGKARLAARKQKLGFVVQPHPFPDFRDDSTHTGGN